MLTFGVSLSTAGAAPKAGDPRGANRTYEAPSSSADPAAPVVSLTFDDGPHPEFTPRILDILKQYGVQATFFELGMNAQRYPDLTRRVVAEGHIIGNHTWDHPRLTRLSDERFNEEIDHTTQLLESITGREVVCTRPPYGDSNPALVAKLAQHGQVSVVWSADSRDFEKPGVDAIVQHALSDLRPGSIILMHDAGGNRDQTIAALPRIIEGIRARGFQIAPVCDRRDHKPYGRLEAVTADAPEHLQASGWTVDPDTHDPIDVHLYVDGAYAAQVGAGAARPDVGASTGLGDGHGYSFAIGATPGEHKVCAFGINTGLGDTNVELGCATVTVAEQPWYDQLGRLLQLLSGGERWEAAPPLHANDALQGLYTAFIPAADG